VESGRSPEQIAKSKPSSMIVVGLWALYILIRERVAELHLRDYLPPIQTIAVGLVLIGLARALQLLLVIFHTA
jgi:hypothetical protein